MSSMNNPVGRLRELLARATQIRDRDRNVLADKAWASLLYVDQGDLAGMLRRMAIVVGLPKEAATAVEGLPNLSHSLFLVWKPKVKAAFGELNIKGRFLDFAQHIDQPTLAMLAICDDLINKSIVEGTVDEKQLEALLNEVRALIEEVSHAAQLDGILREYILRHLHIIDQAIVDYRFQGLPALRSGLESSVGVLLLNRSGFDDAKKSSVGKKLMQILGAYVLILSAVQSTERLVRAATKLLPDLSSRSVEGLPDGEISSAVDMDIHTQTRSTSAPSSASSR